MVKLRKRKHSVYDRVHQLMLKGVLREPSVQDNINILSSADAKSLSVQ